MLHALSSLRNNEHISDVLTHHQEFTTTPSSDQHLPDALNGLASEIECCQLVVRAIRSVNLVFLSAFDPTEPLAVLDWQAPANRTVLDCNRALSELESKLHQIPPNDNHDAIIDDLLSHVTELRISLDQLIHDEWSRRQVNIQDQHLRFHVVVT
ncbi:hypothetical protein FRB99_002237, partial [Tulasnella sp. 403]